MSNAVGLRLVSRTIRTCHLQRGILRTLEELEDSRRIDAGVRQAVANHENRNRLAFARVFRRHMQLHRALRDDSAFVLDLDAPVVGALFARLWRVAPAASVVAALGAGHFEDVVVRIDGHHYVVVIHADFDAWHRVDAFRQLQLNEILLESGAFELCLGFLCLGGFLVICFLVFSLTECD